MRIILLILAVVFLVEGHLLKVNRWELFISIYERPSKSVLLRSLSLGYALNFILPFRMGDIFRVVYAGKKLKNGIGFSFATVIMDRFLDILLVTIIFAAMQLWSIHTEILDDSVRFYFIFTILLTAACTLLVTLRDTIKRLCSMALSIFNDRIKFQGMYVCWSLINTFKDIKRISLFRLLRLTVLMWGCYLFSYYLASICFSWEEEMTFSATKMFLLLFSCGNLDVAAKASVGILGGISVWAGYAMILYTILPLFLLFGITLLPFGTKRAITAHMLKIPENDGKSEFLNLLPQIEMRDKLYFLECYFEVRDRDYFNKFIELNRNINIIRDYSAGSNATTLLCMNKSITFYRKYAFGKEGKKLKEQLDWLRNQRARLPLCEIMNEDCKENYCCYDMEYHSNAITFFHFMHSNPEDRSRLILKDVLDTLNRNLYRDCRKVADDSSIGKYIHSKVTGNLQIIESARELRELLVYKKIRINGKEYKNIRELGYLFEKETLGELFWNDPICEIHGDLTIENIICYSGEQVEKAWYLIDPNTGNIHNSLFLDYAKLLQSLHGGYEFMMMVKGVKVEKDSVEFTYTRSSAYDNLFTFLMRYLRENYSEAEIKSIYFHEIIHWLRLMPYKLKKDAKKAVIFYAGLVMVCNDVDAWFCKGDRFEERKADDCGSGWNLI